MKRLDLIKLLSSSDEEDVLIKVNDVLCEIDEDVEHAEATFDGFDTIFPEALVLKPKENDVVEW